MPTKKYDVVLTDESIEMLRSIGKRYGKKTYHVLRNQILSLETEPERKGRQLRKPLGGLYSLHYSRFRVIYQIDGDQARVLIVAAGDHKSGSPTDVYRVIEQLIKSGDIVIDRKDDAE